MDNLSPLAPLRTRLAGTRILITGTTGFVGEALLSRLLTDFPDVCIVALIRPRGSMTARARLTQLAGKPAFTSWRGGCGYVEQALDRRVSVLDGDLAEIPALPGDLDIVVHCAGEVSFDPPLEEAFETNVHGTVRLLEAITASGSRPHYVHVSTAYVSGRRRGAIAESRVDHDVDWRVEAGAAARVAGQLEDASRAPGTLARLSSASERDHRRAGPLTSSGDTERRRREWVRERSVRAGAERAHSLGWTDTYTFTKAMGERAVEELAGELPVSIVRPSIIESALRVPAPGWIEGFKMAEPIILAYGRGELPEFPAAPDAICDIVPVDHVVGALLAVAARPAQPGTPGYFHVCSGARNPLTYHGLYSLVREYFTAHPFAGRGTGEPRLPVWRWPGGQQVDRLLRTGERAHAVADALITRLPRSDRVRRAAHALDQQSRRLTFLRRYSDLYRPYVETELAFTDDRTLALLADLDPADRDEFGFDPAEIDWTHYIRDVHCPAITAPLRALDAARTRRSGGQGAAPGPAGRSDLRRPAAAALPVLAAFDMDGTLLASNVVESYLWLRLPELSPIGATRELAAVACRLPGYLAAERRDRGAFLRAAYRRYEGASLHSLEQLVDAEVAELVLARVSPEAVRRVRAHRVAGHRTILVTGAIRALTRPLAPLFDVIVAADLAVDTDGVCTGFLAAPPLVGEGRAAWLRRHAELAGADLTASYAYAD
ncbi:MAG TPA: SDR family oxidoreductase, partial [Mycobacteriales bacterium]|nr:SDR family oxidoreductase [Mycobacteriales bacterium]